MMEAVFLELEFFFCFVEGQLIYIVVPVSATQQIDSVVHIYTLFFFLEYNCFTMLCQFLLYNKVISCIYTYIPSLLSVPPTRPNSTPLGCPNGEGNGTPLQYSCLENPMDGGAWQAVVHWVAKSRTRLSNFPFTFQFHALEKEMATHSSVLAWRIPGTGEPGGLLSMGLHRVRHD